MAELEGGIIYFYVRVERQDVEALSALQWLDLSKVKS